MKLGKMGLKISKVIVITRASSGIGETTAKILAEDGAKLVLGARRKERLEKLATEVKGLGGEAVYMATDVTKVEEVEALEKLAIDTFGRIDVWLNNAGLMSQSLNQCWKRKEYQTGMRQLI